VGRVESWVQELESFHLKRRDRSYQGGLVVRTLGGLYFSFGHSRVFPGDSTKSKMPECHFPIPRRRREHGLRGTNPISRACVQGLFPSKPF